MTKKQLLKLIATSSTAIDTINYLYEKEVAYFIPDWNKTNTEVYEDISVWWYIELLDVHRIENKPHQLSEIIQFIESQIDAMSEDNFNSIEQEKQNE